MKQDPKSKSNDRQGRSQDSVATDNRVAQRHHKESQAAQLSAANVEESPIMDRGSEGGAGESLDRRPEPRADESLRRGNLDEQYGTKSSMTTGPGGRASSGGSGPTQRDKLGQGTENVPNPGSSEKSSGAERDTMTTPRPGRDA